MQNIIQYYSNNGNLLGAINTTSTSKNKLIDENVFNSIIENNDTSTQQNCNKVIALLKGTLQTGVYLEFTGEAVSLPNQPQQGIPFKNADGEYTKNLNMYFTFGTTKILMASAFALSGPMINGLLPNGLWTIGKEVSKSLIPKNKYGQVFEDENGNIYKFPLTAQFNIGSRGGFFFHAIVGFVPTTLTNSLQQTVDADFQTIFTRTGLPGDYIPVQSPYALPYLHCGGSMGCVCPSPWQDGLEIYDLLSSCSYFLGLKASAIFKVNITGNNNLKSTFIP